MSNPVDSFALRHAKEGYQWWLSDQIASPAFASLGMALDWAVANDPWAANALRRENTTSSRNETSSSADADEG